MRVTQLRSRQICSLPLQEQTWFWNEFCYSWTSHRISQRAGFSALSTAFISLSEMKIVVSSAYRTNLADIKLGGSIRDKKGPSIETWGAPLDTFRRSDICSPTLTICSLRDKWDLIKDVITLVFHNNRD